MLSSTRATHSLLLIKLYKHATHHPLKGRRHRGASAAINRLTREPSQGSLVNVSISAKKISGAELPKAVAERAQSNVPMCCVGRYTFATD